MKLESVPNVILTASGKGGVGKTTVASDLARAASEELNAVGYIDADISTPNSAEVLGGEGVDISNQRLATKDALVPPTVEGVQLISEGLVLPDDTAVLRGARWRAEEVVDYIENVEWDDETELVVIDSPPGSGEELQVVASNAPITQAYVITTPHPSAIRDARKTHSFFQQAEIPHDVVLNMAYIPTPDLIEHVSEAADFSDVTGVGDAKQDAILEMLTEQVPDYALFDYDEGDAIDIDAEHVATVPYSAEFESRAAALKPLLDRITEPNEVEA